MGPPIYLTMCPLDLLKPNLKRHLQHALEWCYVYLPTSGLVNLVILVHVRQFQLHRHLMFHGQVICL
jgi:hypothetical protein